MDLLSNQAAELEEVAAMTIVDTVGGYGKWAGAKVKLTKSLVAPERDTALADLDAVEADFSGYAAKTVTWLVGSVSDAGEVEVVGTVPEFRHNGGATANNAYNAYITDSAGAVLLAVGAFDSAVPMGNANDSLVVHPRMRLTIVGIMDVVS